MTHIFHAGGALTPDYPYYVERDVDRIAPGFYETLDHNYKYISIIAPRQMGKTSLLHRLASRVQAKGWKCCYISLDTINGGHPVEWFKHLGQQLTHSMGYKNSRSIRNETDFKTFLLDQIGIGSRELATHLALFLDEVGALEGCPASDGFLSVLKAIYNERSLYPGRLAVAFAGTADTSLLIKNPLISPFNVSESLKIDDFKEHEFNELTQYLSMLGVPVEDNVQHHIYEWTSGQPYLTQRVCEILERKTQAGSIKAIRSTDIDQIIDQDLINLRAADSNIIHILRKANDSGEELQKLLQAVLSGKRVTVNRLGTLALYLTGIVEEINREY